MYLFTDCSVSSKFGLGVCAYLSVQDLGTPAESISERIRFNTFEGVTSTELELRTLLWALEECRGTARKATIFTDSQNIVGLPKRRDRLEKSNFQNGSGDRLKLADLYEEFFQRADDYAFDVYKIKGHTRKSERSDSEQLFSFLDRSVRRELCMRLGGWK